MLSTAQAFQHACTTGDEHKVCRSRGGESCAFDGAMIVLQPIADAVHLVHGPIACCGNSWEGRGSLSDAGEFHRMGFTTDLSELDIVYGGERKLADAIAQAVRDHHPAALFVYSTCITGLTGEDIGAVCAEMEDACGLPVIPVDAPGFVGPKNLGNRIAGEVLLRHVIGRGEPDVTTPYDINLIGEYNIAGDLAHIMPVLERCGLRVLSRITGNARFAEITHAHRARLNVVLCGRALINVAAGMAERYGTPYVEASFFGRREMSRALRSIAAVFGDPMLTQRVEAVIADEEAALAAALEPCAFLRGRRAVLYSGGVKSWSLISALQDIGIEVAAVGTKKASHEDEEKMAALLPSGVPRIEDMTAGRIAALMREHKADILVAGGRNQYLAAKEGWPFIDANQERHHAYAGYAGLVTMAHDIAMSVKFYEHHRTPSYRTPEFVEREALPLSVDPVRHSPSIGAAIALQGIDRAIPLLHGAQGCTFLGKVLMTKQYREPVALGGSKLFAEDVVMGAEERLEAAVDALVTKQQPAVVGVIGGALAEVRGEDTAAVVRRIGARHPGVTVLHIPVADYAGSIEEGYARAVDAVLAASLERPAAVLRDDRDRLVTIIAGPHLTPADFRELRVIVEAFGLVAVMVPDLAALDGSTESFSALATGGTSRDELLCAGQSRCAIAIGWSLAGAASRFQDATGMPAHMLDGIAGLHDTDRLMTLLSQISGRPVPGELARQRRCLVDGLRDVHAVTSGKTAALALECDHAVQMSRCLADMGIDVMQALVPSERNAARIAARRVTAGSLDAVDGGIDLLVGSGHLHRRAKRLGVPLLEAGFPVFHAFGASARLTVGYRGTLAAAYDIANVLKEDEP